MIDGETRGSVSDSPQMQAVSPFCSQTPIHLTFLRPIRQLGADAVVVEVDLLKE